jgi:hypothetical protein
MSAAIATQLDVDELHRRRVLAGMRTESFRELFNNEFENLRVSIKQRDWVEVEETIQALEACAVNAAQMVDDK